MEDITRWVNLTFVFAGMLLWWAFARISESVMDLVGVPDAHVLGENLTRATVAGFVAAVLVTGIGWRNKKLYEGTLNVAREVKKVTWPTLDETKAATRVVIVMTIIVALILALFDAVFSRLTGIILGVG
ncbi:MAG: preprotein translocase subunit SecE [Myxococcota bacterium]|jgi:preprotein translocase subunit SecE|nr:preprotein translocase subunit SecE [Myxococcota bacterium]